MSVHNFPKKVFVEVESNGWEDDEYFHFFNIDQAEVGRQVATYELVTVQKAAVKLIAIKPEVAE